MIGSSQALMSFSKVTMLVSVSGTYLCCVRWWREKRKVMVYAWGCPHRIMSVVSVAGPS